MTLKPQIDLAFLSQVYVWNRNVQNLYKNVRFSNIQFAGQCLGMELKLIVQKQNQFWFRMLTVIDQFLIKID